MSLLCASASDSRPPLQLDARRACQEEAYLLELHTHSRAQPGQPAQDDGSPTARLLVRGGPLTRAATAAMRASSLACVSTPSPCASTHRAPSCALDSAPLTPQAAPHPVTVSLAQGDAAALGDTGIGRLEQLPEAVDDDEDLDVEQDVPDTEPRDSSPSPPHSLHIGGHAAPSPETHAATSPPPSNGHTAPPSGGVSAGDGGSPTVKAAPPVDNGGSAQAPGMHGDALLAAVGDLLHADGRLIDISAVPALVRLVGCAAATPADQLFITRVLEGIVTKSTPGSPLLKALVAGGALPAVEMLVVAAAEAKSAPLLRRLLKLAAALPVTMAALQTCGLAKRAKKLLKYSTTPGLASDAAAQAAEVEAAAGLLVEKWMSQVAAETAKAPAEKQPLAKASGKAAPKAVRVVAVDSMDLFASALKPKASKAAATAGAKPGVGGGAVAKATGGSKPKVAVSDPSAKGVVSPRSAAAPGSSAPSSGAGLPAHRQSAATAAVMSQPVVSRLAAEQAARQLAAQMAEQHRANRHQAAVEEAVKEAMTWQSDLYPEGLPPPPTVIRADPADKQQAPHRSCLSRKGTQSKSGGGGNGGQAAPPGAGDVAMADAPACEAAPTPQQPPAPGALRDRKRKRRGVVWAPEASLTQVREFTGDALPEGESVAYPEPTMMTGAAVDGDILISGDLVTRWLNRAKQETAAERRAMDAWRSRHDMLLMHSPAAAPPPAPLMTAINTWAGPPPLVALPTWTGGGPPGRGEESTEAESQARRQASRPPAMYASLAAVPEHPAQGPARSERPEDNVNTRWIVHNAAPPPVQQVVTQPPMQMQFQQPQQQQQQQQAGLAFAFPGGQQQALANQSFGAPLPLMQQQQPLAPASFPMQMAPVPAAQPAPLQQWPAQQLSWQQAQQAQQLQMPTMQTVSPPMPPAHPTPALPSWLTSALPASVLPAQQQQSAVGAGQPAAAPSGDQLGDLVRSLTQAGNASVLQQALEGMLQQQGSAPAAQAFSAAAFTTPGLPPPNPPPPRGGMQHSMGVAPPHPGNGIACHFYNRPGGCRLGSGCRFMHAM